MRTPQVLVQSDSGRHGMTPGPLSVALLPACQRRLKAAWTAGFPVPSQTLWFLLKYIF